MISILGESYLSQECLGEKESKEECEPLQIRREVEETPEFTHSASNTTVEEKEQEEAATVSLTEEDTHEEGQSFLSAKESIKLHIQPRCPKPV